MEQQLTELNVAGLLQVSIESNGLASVRMVDATLPWQNMALTADLR